MKGRSLGYVSKLVDANGHCHVTLEDSDIAIVNLTAKGRLHDINIVVLAP